MDPAPREQRRSDGSVVAVAIAAIVLTLCGVGVAAYYFGKSNGSSTPATTAGSGGGSSGGQTAAVPQQVALGAHAFVQFACAQCHGAQGAGGVSPYVPALHTAAADLTAAQLTSIIEHGAGVSKDPT